MLVGKRRLVRWVTVGAVASFGLFAVPARAQDASGKAAAEALFESGVQLMKAGRFNEACPKLETSQRVDPGVGTLLYLAECYEKLGRTASAWATFREAESLARAQNQLERSRTAQVRAQKLEPDLAYLTVNVSPEARVEGLVIRRGSVNVLPELYGVAAPVDPGTIEIEAGAPGYRRWSGQVRVAARDKDVITIPKLEADPTAEAPPAAPLAAAPVAAAPSSDPASDPQPSDLPPPPKKDHTLAFVVGGVGVVGLGVGTYFGLRAMSKNDDSKESCDDNNVCQDQQAEALTKEAKDAALVSTIGFAVGGAALAASIVLFVTAPGGDESTALRITPRVAKNGGGLSIGGSFR